MVDRFKKFDQKTVHFEFTFSMKINQVMIVIIRKLLKMARVQIQVTTKINKLLIRILSGSFLHSQTDIS